jgi:hypothetical protein
MGCFAQLNAVEHRARCRMSLADSRAHDRVMADPSLLLSNRQLFGDPQLARNLIVSKSFATAVAQGQLERLAPFIPPVSVPPSGYIDDSLSAWRRSAARRLLEIETFSAEEVQELPDDVSAVLKRIRQLSTPAAEILADEWVYLATQSWLASKTQFVLDKIRESGAEVHEYARRSVGLLQEAVGGKTKLVGDRVALVRARLVVELIKDVTGETPPEPLTPEIIARARIKWIVYGVAVGVPAAGGAAIGGPGGAALGAVAGNLALPVIRAFDP